jgi:hypothetical protein
MRTRALFALVCSLSVALTGASQVAGSAALQRTATAAARWRVMPVPNVGMNSTLYGITCLETSDCFAVGGGVTSHALVLHWNGAVWSVQPTPSVTGGVTASLLSISCTAANDCAAVGRDTNNTTQVTHTLTERWNGTTWALTPSPSVSSTPARETMLSSVSCLSSANCFAVGVVDASPGTPLAEHWNGTSWSIQPFPSGSNTYDYELYSLTCTSIKWCEAVGDYSRVPSQNYEPLAAHWNGTTWSVDRTPATPKGNKVATLDGIACPSQTQCLAVGASSDLSTQVAGRVAEQWNGHAWSIVITPAPAQAVDTGFYGVTCLSVSNCVVVGLADTNTTPLNELVERLSGTNWSVDATPGRGEYLTSVACNAPSTCTAAGGGSVSGALIERSP